MQEEIEQLKADKAALEMAQIVMRKHGGYVSELVIETGIRIQDKIKELEKQANDPWEDAKELMQDYIDRDHHGVNYEAKVARYAKHLEEKVKQLENTAIPAEVFQRAALQRRIKNQRRELKRLNNAMKQWAAKALLDYEKIKELGNLAYSSNRGK